MKRLAAILAIAIAIAGCGGAKATPSAYVAPTSAPSGTPIPTPTPLPTDVVLVPKGTITGSIYSNPTFGVAVTLPSIYIYTPVSAFTSPSWNSWEQVTVATQTTTADYCILYVRLVPGLTQDSFASLIASSAGVTWHPMVQIILGGGAAARVDGDAADGSKTYVDEVAVFGSGQILTFVYTNPDHLKPYMDSIKITTPIPAVATPKA